MEPLFGVCPSARWTCVLTCFCALLKQKRVEKETEDKGKSRLLHSILGGPPRKPGPSSQSLESPTPPFFPIKINGWSPQRYTHHACVCVSLLTRALVSRHPELFHTERAHLHMLRVMDSVFYQKLSRDAILPPADIKSIFANLQEIIQLHVSIIEQMTAIRKEKVSVIDHVGDVLLSWVRFSGAEEEKMKQAGGTFCSNQPFALELIKSRQKKEQRFAAAMQEAESSPLCRRLQLKDIIPAEMQRLTKYPLLLENIAKYTEDPEEREKVRRASECCRQILNHVNQAVKEAENKQVPLLVDRSVTVPWDLKWKGCVGINYSLEL
uniref:Rho guanine nucleotide exchange factor 12 n=1 Tax=Paramormyrops kingsleyae TaxID=1676925 RepID=A0A3B3RR70_9TELE